MAIALDATANGGITAFGTTNTFAHTCTGSDLILIVVAGDPFAGVSGVTYNGVALAKIDTNGQSTNTIWFLANPATGAHNVVVTRGSDGTSNSIPLVGQSISYTGADPTQPASMDFETSPDTSPRTTNTEVPSSNCWLIGSGWGASDGDNFMTTDKTSRQTQKFTYLTTVHRALILADSNGTIAAGTQGITFTEAGTLSQFDTGVFSIWEKGDIPTAAEGGIINNYYHQT